MQKIKILFASLVASLIAATAQAQVTVTPVSSGGGGSSSPSVSNPLPISSYVSEDAVREQALARVVSGSRSVGAKSMDYNFPGSFTYTNVVGNGAEDVLTKLFAAQFKYRLGNPDDKIEGYIYLYNSDGTVFFQGYASYTAKDLKVGPPQYNIWPQNLPVLSNVDSAEILAIAEDGTTARRFGLQVSSRGNVLLGASYAGITNAVLSVKFNDGTLATYRLSDPKAQTPGTSQETVSGYNIDGHHVFVGAPAQPLVVDIMELYALPTALVTVVDSGAVTFNVRGLSYDFRGQFFERPYEIILTQVGGTWKATLPMLSDKPTVLDLQPGVYRVRFNWRTFHKSNNLYTGPESSDGGKG